MVSRILVPLDGSRFAEVAAPVAVRLAQDTGAALRFLLIHETRVTTAMLPDGAIITPQDDALIRASAQKYLDELLGRIDRKTVTATADLRDGVAATTLAGEIDAWKADIVVMATHGRGPVTRFWLGSVADYLIRHVSTPILLLRPKDPVDWPAADLKLRTIVVPVDLSPASQTVVEPALELAKLHGARIELVNVVEPVLGVPTSPFQFPLPSMTEVDERNRLEAEQALAAIGNRLATRGVPVSTKVLIGTTVASAILEHLETTHPDLVAIATHGRGGFRRALVGSVADKVIRATHLPVLIVRPRP